MESREGKRRKEGERMKEGKGGKERKERKGRGEKKKWKRTSSVGLGALSGSVTLVLAVVGTDLACEKGTSASKTGERKRKSFWAPTPTRSPSLMCETLGPTLTAIPGSWERVRKGRKGGKRSQDEPTISCPTIWG
jgi:hypothetical protein